MSPREEVSARVYKWLLDHREYNAPWGVLESISDDRRYRSITFGRAGHLDAEVRVYTPLWIMVRWMRGRYRDSKIFKGEGALPSVLAFIEYEL